MASSPDELRAVADLVDELLLTHSVWASARRAEDLLISARGELRLRAIELEERTITAADAAQEGQG